MCKPAGRVNALLHRHLSSNEGPTFMGLFLRGRDEKGKGTVGEEQKEERKLGNIGPSLCCSIRPNLVSIRP